MISLIDKTAQVETERSLRSEMLRDSLTGLPNRFAFNERVEEALAEPAFADQSYAVLAVDMNPDKEEVARSFGADAFLVSQRGESAQDLARRMREAFAPNPGIVANAITAQPMP